MSFVFSHGCCFVCVRPRNLHVLHVEQAFFFLSHFCNRFFSHFYCFVCFRPRDLHIHVEQVLFFVFLTFIVLFVCFRPRDLHILHVESRTLIPSAIFLFPPHTPTTRRRSPACSSPAFFCVLTLRCSILPPLCSRLFLILPTLFYSPDSVLFSHLCLILPPLFCSPASVCSPAPRDAHLTTRVASSLRAGGAREQRDGRRERARGGHAADGALEGGGVARGV